jgi:hypothetical protein
MVKVYPRKPGIQSDEQIETLLLADLAHDEPVRTHT